LNKKFLNCTIRKLKSCLPELISFLSGTVVSVFTNAYLNKLALKKWVVHAQADVACAKID
jgi:hypothetical protein